MEAVVSLPISEQRAAIKHAYEQTVAVYENARIESKRIKTNLDIIPAQTGIFLKNKKSALFQGALWYGLFFRRPYSPSVHDADYGVRFD